MKDLALTVLANAVLPILVSLFLGVIYQNVKPVAKAAAEAYMAYRDKLLEEAKRFQAEEVVRAVEQAARANLIAATERHHQAAAMLLARIPGLSLKEADSLILATVAALKEEFKKADEISANKVAEPGDPLVELEAPLQ